MATPGLFRYVWQVTPERAFLIATLERVIAGGEVTYEQLIEAVPEPHELSSKVEMDAWFHLSYWSSDADVREKDPKYGPSQMRWLIRFLDQLRAGI